MIRYLISGLLIFGVLAPAQVTDEEVTERTFQLGPTPSVTVDALNGFIEVEGHDGNVIELVVRRHLEADSEADAKKARDEERLEITQEGNALDLYVNGPYRCNDRGINYRGRRHYGYKSRFDFTLRAPRRAALDLRTINEAHIDIRNTSGDFKLNVINGGVRMKGVTGSGRARTINGDIETAYASGFSGDFRVKTFNGDVFTDFPASALTPRAPRQTTRRGMRVYKTDGFTGIRIGSAGGPEIELDTLNGDIRITRSNQP